MDKPFKTYSELLDFLENEKRLSVPDRAMAKDVLSKTGYYSLITGYKEIYKDKTSGLYKRGVTFDDIYNLYCFDRELRSIFLKYILIAEKSVKTSLAYHFSDIYGADDAEYCDPANYNVSGKKEKDGLKKLLTIFSYNLSGKTDYTNINHYLNKHHNVPLWIMVQALTLGQFSHMFDYLNAKAPICVCKDYHNVSRNQMHTFLSVMTKHRNVCAHGDRFYNYRTKDSLADTAIHAKLSIPMIRGRYSNGKNDVFSEVIILKYLLDKDDYRSFHQELSRCFKKYKPDSMVVFEMGFVGNWKNTIRYKLPSV
ncbi:MAG: Abi family protein [Lachnospiraceae bacterium]|nr:Abi family protein [Lachnospiraceae bacterium]